MPSLWEECDVSALWRDGTSSGCRQDRSTHERVCPMPSVLRGHPAFRDARDILRLPEPQVTPMPGVHREPHIAMMNHRRDLG